MLGLIGAGLAAAGGISQTFGNRKSHNDARKARLGQLNQGMKDFQLGSTDAGGNRFNFNDKRGWGYDLSNSGRAAQTAANRGNYLMNTLGNISPSQARNNIVAADYKAARNQANANQSAATRNALRTGSNLGAVTNSMGSTGSYALRNAMQQNMRNGLSLQAQNANNYAQSAQNLAQNINNIQSNLQNMQNGAATQQLQLRQAMAEAAGIPKVNMMQTLGKTAQGVGQAIAHLGQSDIAKKIEDFKASLNNNNNNNNDGNGESGILSKILPDSIQQFLSLFGG